MVRWQWNIHLFSKLTSLIDIKDMIYLIKTKGVGVMKQMVFGW
jgi:hypothetical protein